MPYANHVHLTKQSRFDPRKAYSLIVPWYPASASPTARESVLHLYLVRRLACRSHSGLTKRSNFGHDLFTEEPQRSI